MNNFTVDSDFREILVRRIKARFSKFDWTHFKLTSFYIGGNSLNANVPNDIDFFPILKEDFAGISSLFRDPSKFTILAKTKNAITVEYQNNKLQFCNYTKDNLHSLIKSFDFAHIQIGAKIVIKDFKQLQVEEIYYTPQYLTAALSQSTQFVGSEYPLSSLVRIIKYSKRGDFKGKSYMIAVMKVLTSIIQRGFKDYEDFKDQLDSVDLGLLPEDFADLQDSDFLATLFKLLRKD